MKDTGPDLWAEEESVTDSIPSRGSVCLHRGRLEPLPRSPLPETDRLEPVVDELSPRLEPPPRPPLPSLPRLLEALAGVSGTRNCPSPELKGLLSPDSRSGPLGTPSRGGVALRGTLGSVAKATLARRLSLPVWLRIRVMRPRML